MIRLAVFAVCAALLAMLVKKQSPQIALAMCLTAGALLLLSVLDSMKTILNTLGSLAQSAGVSGEYLGMAVKLLGVSYLCEFAAQTCRDAGEGGLAQKVEVGGKITLMGMSMPVLLSIFTYVEGMMP